MKIVSVCLAGIPCTYNGTSASCPKVVAWVQQGKAIPVCPETLGGLPIPREVAEKINGKVITISGKDVTKAFVVGAEKALGIAKNNQCNEAILYSNTKKILNFGFFWMRELYRRLEKLQVGIKGNNCRFRKRFGMKFRSPSCGVGKIYDGTFTHTLVDGDGIFTELLKKNNIKVSTENEL